MGVVHFSTKTEAETIDVGLLVQAALYITKCTWYIFVLFKLVLIFCKCKIQSVCNMGHKYFQENAGRALYLISPLTSTKI